MSSATRTRGRSLSPSSRAPCPLLQLHSRPEFHLASHRRCLATNMCLVPIFLVRRDWYANLQWRDPKVLQGFFLVCLAIAADLGCTNVAISELSVPAALARRQRTLPQPHAAHHLAAGGAAANDQGDEPRRDHPARVGGRAQVAAPAHLRDDRLPRRRRRAHQGGLLRVRRLDARRADDGGGGDHWRFQVCVGAQDDQGAPRRHDAARAAPSPRRRRRPGRRITRTRWARWRSPSGSRSSWA